MQKFTVEAITEQFKRELFNPHHGKDGKFARGKGGGGGAAAPAKKGGAARSSGGTGEAAAPKRSHGNTRNESGGSAHDSGAMTPGVKRHDRPMPDKVYTRTAPVNFIRDKYGIGASIKIGKMKDADVHAMMKELDGILSKNPSLGAKIGKIDTHFHDRPGRANPIMSKTGKPTGQWEITISNKITDGKNSSPEFARQAIRQAIGEIK